MPGVVKTANVVMQRFAVFTIATAVYEFRFFVFDLKVV